MASQTIVYRPIGDGLQRKLSPILTGYAQSSTRPIRPVSEATEFNYSEEDNDGDSDIEESPPGSSNSDGRRSQSTISIYEEVQTPRSDHKEDHFQIVRPQSTQGPRGPHLFRVSQDYHARHYDNDLQLSPLHTKDFVQPPTQAISVPRSTNATPKPTIDTQLPLDRLASSPAVINEGVVRSWTARDVGNWMYNQGFEGTVIDKFEEHNIDGIVLLDMHFDDLKELEIPSFGKRHQIWNDLAGLRHACAATPVGPSPQEVVPQPLFSKTTPLARSMSMREPRRPELDGMSYPRIQRRGRFSAQTTNDVVAPAESISIVAIEQLIPKIHKCGQGENCPKWKRQQPLLNSIARERGVAVSDLETLAKVESMADPEPSVVASSDVMGPGQQGLPLLEEVLCTVQERDPQENVKQFLTFQHLHPERRYIPPSPQVEPPLEMFPSLTPPTSPPAHLQMLPKLSIPTSPGAGEPTTTVPLTARPRTISPSNQTYFSSPFRSSIFPGYINRRGTPASEMDIPITAFPIDPVGRETSQSVPPNMHYHEPTPPSPPLSPIRPTHRRHYSALESPTQNFSRRAPFHLSPVPEAEKPELPARSTARLAPKTIYGDTTTHAGWMKKRKTKLLRHDWSDAHFRLHGTKLAMHGSAAPTDTRPLDTIDVDHYAVACSSIGSNSKISAALKSLKLKSGDGHGRRSSMDDAAFAFQLIPEASSGARKAPALGATKLTKDAPGKTHHFAVKSRDERIDWMREVMLAKAVKQKSVGYEVTVNGRVV